jgi:phosphoglycolate phosphatase
VGEGKIRPSMAAGWSPPSGMRLEVVIHRLVLWNIDLTLVDVVQVTREACADAFREVTGRPLVRLPQMPGMADSEVFFDALALNAEELAQAGNSQHLLADYNQALAKAFEARSDLLTKKGRLLPGAKAALTAVGALPGVVQTVLTGTIKPNAILKMRVFGLDGLVDLDVGGYGSEAYPRGTLLQVARTRAAEAHGLNLGEASTVYIGDSPRDVEAAKIGGAWSIAVASGRATHAELAAAGADAVLDDLTDTPALTRTVDRLTTPHLP